MMERAVYRFYQNFLMAERLDEYDRLLRSLTERGYTFLTIADLARCVMANRLPELSCIIRVDVDSDIPTARSMFEIGQASRVPATYYFRLSTIDQVLMRQIANSGAEVGFHYEELATIAKRLGLRDRSQVDERMADIRESFATNLATFAAQLGQWPMTIASHGDWINRLLCIPNQYAINQALRDRFGIIAEAYDGWLNAPVKGRFSDTDPPAWWKPCSPAAAISSRTSCLYFLVHPRQWHANALENIRIDMTRIVEASRYTFRRALNDIGTRYARVAA